MTLVNLNNFRNNNGISGIFDWLDENVSPMTYSSHPDINQVIKNRFSHDYRRRGDGWSYHFLITTNKQDTLPEDFALVRDGGTVVGQVYEYVYVSFDNDAHAVQFRLVFGNGN